MNDPECFSGLLRHVTAGNRCGNDVVSQCTAAHRKLVDREIKNLLQGFSRTLLELERLNKHKAVSANDKLYLFVKLDGVDYPSFIFSDTILSSCGSIVDGRTTFLIYIFQLS
jgi:hypothetical protein